MKICNVDIYCLIKDAIASALEFQILVLISELYINLPLR